jgi:phage pi2 protein 07
MIFSQDRQELRKMYVDAWRKFTAGEKLSSLEQQIAQVIDEHPEYQPMLRPEMLEAAFTPEQGQSNPFLHMGLHLAIREQVATDRPAGIAILFKALREKSADTHAAEHKALDCLAETLWEAQSQNVMPDEAKYLERLRSI